MTSSTPAPARSLAVVTGASSGIGFELAKQFAAHDFDLIIAAEDDAIRAAAAELEGLGGTVEAVQVDLAADGGVDELYRHITAAGHPVEAVALNAGIGAGGAFATDTSLEDELRLIDLNVRSTVHVAKYVVRDMVGRDRGRVLFTSSIASTMPGAFQAVYNASKSFVQSFALALRNELKDTEVTVTSLMPGPTETEFFERADMLDTKGRRRRQGRPRRCRPRWLRGADGRRRARRLRITCDQAAGARQPAAARRRQGRAAPQDGEARIGRSGGGVNAGSVPRLPPASNAATAAASLQSTVV